MHKTLYNICRGGGGQISLLAQAYRRPWLTHMYEEQNVNQQNAATKLLNVLTKQLRANLPNRYSALC